MDCSRTCGLTRRETNPASAEGSGASWSVARVVSNGRRLRAVRVGIRATECIPAMLKHAIVQRPRRTRELMFFANTREGLSPAVFSWYLDNATRARHSSTRTALMASHVGRLPVANRRVPRPRVARRPAGRCVAAAGLDSWRVSSDRSQQRPDTAPPNDFTGAVGVGADINTTTTTRRAALTGALVACVAPTVPEAFAKLSTTESVLLNIDPARSYHQNVPTLFAPLFGDDSRETILTCVVPDVLWFLTQNLALGPLETPIRCVVVKLEDGGLWVHAPLAPTSEFFSLIESLGDVQHVVVPTYALEHKIFAKDALVRWPASKLWVVTGQFSFPVEVSDEYVFGRIPDGVLGVGGRDGRVVFNENKAQNPPWLNEIECDVLRAGRFDVLGKDVSLYEATFLHRKTKTLIVTDCVALIPSEIPPLQTPEKLLLVGKTSTDNPQPPDTLENRRRGWKKMCLLITYFFPEHEDLVRPGLVTWSEGWETNFAAIADRLLVPPVVRATLYSQGTCWGFPKSRHCSARLRVTVCSYTLRKTDTFLLLLHQRPGTGEKFRGPRGWRLGF